MPVYFGEVAPYCPISKDQPVGPMSAPQIRTTIPIARDLPSAIAAVNILRTIVSQIVRDTVINNVYSPPPPKPRTPPADRLIDKRRHARWTEVKGSKVKRRYKYYAKDANGNKDEDTWVMTERIEQMIWYDRGWKAYLGFQYGDKGDDGEYVPPSGSGS